MMILQSVAILILVTIQSSCTEQATSEEGVCKELQAFYYMTSYNSWGPVYYSERYEYECINWPIWGRRCYVGYRKRYKTVTKIYYNRKKYYDYKKYCCKGYTGEPPNCKRLCEQLNHPKNGYLYYEKGKKVYYNTSILTFPGYKAHYQCDFVSMLYGGDEVRTCQRNGLGWTGKQPSCLAPCTKPNPPQNGEVVTGDAYGYRHYNQKGDTIRYKCNEGYTLAGNSQRKCQLNESVPILYWDGTQPTCKEKGCGDPGAPDNGTRFGNQFTYLSNPLIFKCDNEFALIGSNARRCGKNGKFSGTQPICKPILDHCEGSGSIVLDQCSRRCECDSNNELVKCTRVRKSWTDLSSDEKQRYINAVKTITTDDQYKDKYEELLRNYTQTMIALHSKVESHGETDIRHSQILDDRLFLLQYENMLREIDCRITIPYWDWTAYRETPYKHPVWDNTLGFGDSSNADECVSKGPFKELKIPVDLDKYIDSIKEDSRSDQYYNYDIFNPSDLDLELPIDEDIIPHDRFEESQETAPALTQQAFYFPSSETKVYTLRLGDIIGRPSSNTDHYFYNSESSSHCLRREYRRIEDFPSWQSIVQLLHNDIYIPDRSLISYKFSERLSDMTDEVLRQVGGHLSIDGKRVFDPIYPLHLSFIDFIYDTWRGLPYLGKYFYDNGPYFGNEYVARRYLDNNKNLPGGVSISYNVPDFNQNS